jgi:hypothetical protein
MLRRRAFAAALVVLLAGCTSHHSPPSHPLAKSAASVAGTGSIGGTEAIADFRPGTTRRVVSSIATACLRTSGVIKVLPPLMRTGPQRIPTVTFGLGYYVPRDQSRFDRLRTCLLRHSEVTQVLVPM